MGDDTRGDFLAPAPPFLDREKLLTMPVMKSNQGLSAAGVHMEKVAASVRAIGRAKFSVTGWAAVLRASLVSLWLLHAPWIAILSLRS